MNRGKASDWQEVSLDAFVDLRGATDEELLTVARALCAERKVQIQSVVFTAHCEIYVRIDGADALELSIEF